MKKFAEAFLESSERHRQPYPGAVVSGTENAIAGFMNSPFGASQQDEQNAMPTLTDIECSGEFRSARYLT